MVTISFAQARATMRQSFEISEDLRLVYQANIAMLLSDKYGITDRHKRDEAAEDILKLIFFS